MELSLKNIPQDPGVYQYYKADGTIIYIGKAKNLRNRVRSYWSNFSNLEPAKQEMVKKITRIEYIVVNNEKEALLLEAGLIRKYMPQYNIVLRDDKDWSYIVITTEAFPRIIKVHGHRKLKGEYFGPYTRAAQAAIVVKLLHRILPLRTCKRDLSKLPNGRVCMQYHLGHCLGPCEKKINTNDYTTLINQARQILKGDTKAMIRSYETEMRQSSEREQYEKAALYRNKIRALRSLTEPQSVIHPLLANQDVIAVANDADTAIITVMQMRHGRMLDTFNYPIMNILGASRQEIFEQFLLQHYGQSTVRPRQILLPEHVSPTAERALAPMKIIYPQRGRNKRLLVMAEKNAWVQYHKRLNAAPLPQHLYDLKKTLNLAAAPVRIEAYDISNISGEYAVGAMVVAINGKLTPSQYRKFKIKTVVGPNDVAMMREMILRRQKHDEWDEPQLIVLDGGKPQLNIVYPILKSAWKDRIVALAKREEEIFVPGRKASIRLGKKDPQLLLLRKVRDAVHNQAIRYYRKLHGKGMRSR